MLTRAALERPYVLCELAVAYSEKKNIKLVRVDWPGEGDSLHGRQFAFPRHLDEAIEEWEEVAYFQRARFNEADMEYRPLNGLVTAIHNWQTSVMSYIRSKRADAPSDVSRPLTTAATLCMKLYGTIAGLVGRTSEPAYVPMVDETPAIEAHRHDEPAEVTTGTAAPVSTAHVTQAERRAVTITPDNSQMAAQKGKRAPTASALLGGLRTPSRAVSAASHFFSGRHAGAASGNASDGHQPQETKTETGGKEMLHA